MNLIMKDQAMSVDETTISNYFKCEPKKQKINSGTKCPV